MVVVPSDTVVIKPVVLWIVAIVASVLDHTPPETTFDKTGVVPIHTEGFPKMGPGTGLTVTEVVATQPVDGV
jgi:hypothetical protein